MSLWNHRRRQQTDGRRLESPGTWKKSQRAWRRKKGPRSCFQRAISVGPFDAFLSDETTDAFLPLIVGYQPLILTNFDSPRVMYSFLSPRPSPRNNKPLPRALPQPHRTPRHPRPRPGPTIVSTMDYKSAANARDSKELALSCEWLSTASG